MGFDSAGSSQGRYTDADATVVARCHSHSLSHSAIVSLGGCTMMLAMLLRHCGVVVASAIISVAFSWTLLRCWPFSLMLQ